jgi:DNA helicase II / ATP-dependent DNA helicase PcrA
MTYPLIPTKTISTESLWEGAKFSPNDQQREAILYTDGPLYLTAGPGSGKKEYFYSAL